jgi:hypothetical protein
MWKTMVTIYRDVLSFLQLSYRSLLLFSLCGLFTCTLQIKAAATEVDETRRQAVYEKSKLKAEKNEEREAILKPGNLSESSRAVGDALREYQETKSLEALEIISAALAPGSESTMIFTALLELPLDSQTYGLLREFIKRSDSRYRAAAIDRLKFAPAALDMNEAQVAELLEFLESITKDSSSSDYRMIGTAERVIKQLEKEPYIGADRASEEISKKVEVIKEPVDEIPATSPAPEVEEAAQEVTAPEPATKEPAEITPVEMAEESPEQSSQWWLWLVGALVVVGGLGMLLRRKS